MKTEIKNNGRRTPRHFAFGDRFGHLLRSILPLQACPAAAATCRFVFLGKNANGNVYGKGTRAYLQTFGERPNVGQNCVQIAHQWAEVDSHESIGKILGCFGITVDDVYNHYGMPDEGDKYNLDLVDVVGDLRPNFWAVSSPHAMQTVALSGSLGAYA